MKPGYKQTEVGVIPEEWEVKTFREIGKLTKGKGLLKEDIKRIGSIPAIPYTALYTDFSEVLNYCDIKWFIDDETQSVIVREPCVLLASSSNMEANTGKASALVGTAPVAIGREVIVFKTSSDCKFISYLLSTPTYRKKTLTLARGTTIKHLYPATFQNYQIALPSLPEQRAIASALSDMDALLASLDRLIAKKRDLKKAAMQQLLTGQTRLPGFKGMREEKRVLDLGDVVTGGTPRTDVAIFWGNDYPWITPTDISAHRDMFTSERTITRKGLDSIRALPPNTVLVTCIASIGKNAILRTAGACNQQINAVTPNNNNSAEFLYYVFEASKQYLQANAGTTATSIISKATFAQLTFTVPPLPEQTAIATVLSDMDLELAALEQRRDKTRALKQGMMQELLTGRTRLV
jgi:type I restriction enzyme, S subunit